MDDPPPSPAPLLLRLRSRLITVASVLLVVHLLYLLLPDPLHRWERTLQDTLLRIRTHLERTTAQWTLANAEAAQFGPIIQVDANFYYDLDQHSQVVRALTEAGVRTQAIDFVFTQTGADAAQAAFGEAIAEDGHVVLGGRLQTGDADHSPGVAPTPLPPAPQVDSRAFQSSDPAARAQLADHGLQTPAPLIARDAAGIGLLDLPLDDDGRIRHIPLVFATPKGVLPGMALMAVAEYLRVPADRIQIAPGRWLRLAGARTTPGAPPRQLTIPIDAAGRMRLDPARIEPAPPRFAYSEIISEGDPAGAPAGMKGRLDGGLAVVSERVENAFILGGQDPGVEGLHSGGVLALAIGMMLDERFIYDAPIGGQWTLEVCLLMLLVGISLRLRPWALVLSAAGAAVGGGGVALLLLSTTGWLIMPLRLLMLIPLAILPLMLIGSLETARKLTALRQARRLAERELAIGRRIQSGFFPHRLPRLEGWQLACRFKAARQVGGDFYDIFWLSKDGRIAGTAGKRCDATLAIVVADVCDKGVGAALFMGLFRTLLRVTAAHLSPPKDALAAVFSSSRGAPNAGISTSGAARLPHHTISVVNHYMVETHDREAMFATIFFALLNPASGRLDYVNAGHEPPLLLGSTGTIEPLVPTGPAVGAFAGARYRTATVRLKPGDHLLAYTDGVPESIDINGNDFGRQRIEDLLKEAAQGPDALLDGIGLALERHRGISDPFDDITMLALKRDPGGS
ncbi:MAG: SpoIIE family protein phosphatase [Desulfosarcinaceae bacterium]|nr:SpoIIE family protein phosphatase [Desulfosarcinaceae bacterium]